MSNKLTMAQIAEELGVSRNAVSAVINGRARKLGLALATEDKIKAYLEERGYVKSKSAMQLRGGGTVDSVGILTCGPFAQIPHLVEALHILSEAIKSKYGHVEIIGIDTAQIKKGLQEVVAQGVNKLIWIHASAPEEEAVNLHKLAPLLKQMKRVVIYNYDLSIGEKVKDYSKYGIDLVGVDRPACYREVARFLNELGHSTVALDDLFIDHPKRLAPNIDWLLKAFTEKGFTVYGLRDVPIGFETDHAKMSEHLIKLFKEKKVTCAFIRNDQRAVEIMGRIQQKGLRVPEDISIIGFGDYSMTSWVNPALTTFGLPVEEMCQETIRLIYEETPVKQMSKNFNTELVIRRSHFKTKR